MPYKVADVITILSENENYCFVNAPEEIKQSLGGAEGISFNSSIKDCRQGERKVCFSSSGCDIDVYLDAGKVRKQGKDMYYYGNLLYGAIFGSPENYECN